ncbi:hypothetical protein AOQ84DRAFT_361694 [Glonium stellatum]|uniref:Uncharacterized protein n=1 Tax=Glonium stellatum TaxID=574774 RepID=A0A8E2F789_9PEZI|nr:hypothetical protein AOQ84DRAFT_361694 [Glonium stellatum]
MAINLTPPKYSQQDSPTHAQLPPSSHISTRLTPPPPSPVPSRNWLARLLRISLMHNHPKRSSPPNPAVGNVDRCQGLNMSLAAAVPAAHPTPAPAPATKQGPANWTFLTPELRSTDCIHNVVGFVSQHHTDWIAVRPSSSALSKSTPFLRHLTRPVCVTLSPSQ